MRLAISRRVVRWVGRGLLTLLLLSGSLVGLYYLGVAVTPPPVNGGLPVIYSPSVQRTIGTLSEPPDPPASGWALNAVRRMRARVVLKVRQSGGGSCQEKTLWT